MEEGPPDRHMYYKKGDTTMGEGDPDHLLYYKNIKKGIWKDPTNWLTKPCPAIHNNLRNTLRDNNILNK